MDYLNLVNDKSFIKPTKKHDSQFANHEHVMVKDEVSICNTYCLVI